MYKRQQKEQHKTVLAVEHSSQEISEKADEVVVLSDARVVWQGNPEVFFRELELVDKYGIKPLPVSKIGWKLYRKGYIKKEEIPLTVNDAYKLIIKLLDGKKLVFEPKEEKRIEAKKLIEVRNLHYKYDKSKEAIRGVDLDVYEGDLSLIHI